MSPKPGDEAGECKICGKDATVCIGFGESVLGVYCKHCLIVTVLPGTYVHGGDRVDSDGEATRTHNP